MTLLEVLVALAILGTAGVATLTALTSGLRAEREAGARERVLADEERVLAAMTLLKRGELDQRIGRHRIGEFVVDVQRPERTLFRIAIGREETPHVEELVTVVYRSAAQ
jgi:type II secretory pathway pseudopilin PulG